MPAKSHQFLDTPVRGLAATLNISKPAITRALDRLEELEFTKREKDKLDRRSVIARRTPTGMGYLRTLSGYMTAADKLAKNRWYRLTPHSVAMIVP